MASFFERLQDLDQTMKKRVLVVSTIVIMAIVIVVWAIYFNSIVIGGGASQQSADTATPVAPAPVVSLSANPAPVAPAGPGLWQRIESGIGSFFATLARPIEVIFKNPANYTIQPQ